ncbi:carbohydrate kinase family protein [bacterium]|nr:carbohydrate kinase family protein [bacterium]MCI0565788.1 carbohydrate kinase family protein [bacterium]MCI0680356.1 carbohydrate kinase family protein [bacterium]
MNENNDFDFIALGDITTDAFIRLIKANVYYDQTDHEEKICLTNGSKIPFESVTVVPAVGNSPNAAVSAARLGLRAALVTNLGSDGYGKEDIETLKKNSVDTRFVRVHEGKPSNYHFVLWYRAERTILIKHEEYEYALPDIGNPRWLYFSSVGENSLPYHHEIAKYLAEHPSIKLAFQPGTFQIKLGYEQLKDLYAVTELFFCNVEEARLILGSSEENPAKLARDMRNRGPKITVITDGPKGAYAYDGTDAWYMPIYPDPAPPFERTGAGDAFASTFTASLALGKSVAESLKIAPVNSMSVVQKIGAQAGLLSMPEIEAWLQKAPADYFPRKVEV